MKKTLTQILALFCIELIILLPVYIVDALTVSSVNVQDITANSAKISWTTDENSNSVVYYGAGNALDKVKKENTLLKDHSVSLGQLTPNNGYSFIAGSCIGSDCVNSTKESFNTVTSQTASGGTQLKLDIEIPDFISKRAIDIIGTTEPFSDVKLFVNNLNTPERFLDSSRVQDGKFKFLNVILQKENVIKITAKDPAGNENEKTFRVSVDTDDPEVVLDRFPNVTTKRNISIVGTVNEQVNIDVFLIKDAGFIIPKRVTGLEATVASNSVKLEWDEIETSSFSHYIVYRDDVPIAITESQSYNTYTDLLVNSGSTYTYRVSAVSILGREGSKSSPVTAAIPSGGKKDIPVPGPVDVSPPARNPVLRINTSGSFSGGIDLGKDGTYALIIEVADRADNKVVFQHLIVKDTMPPPLKITRPRRGASIYENYANQVDIEGITEPNAEVHLFVQRIPIPPGYINKSFDISGLPNNIMNLPETKLRADCKLDIGGKAFCPTGADFSTIADNQGNFFFDGIDLTSIFSGAISVRQESLIEFGRTDVLRDPELRGSMRSTLVFIATDKSGLRNAEKVEYNIVNCWSGNQTWDIIPLTGLQSPSLISTERLAEGTEEIQFAFDYNYIGRGENGFIDDVSISKACQGTEFLDEARFNTSCEILPPGAQSVVNQDGTKSHTTIKLNRLPNMDKWLADDWDNFFSNLGTRLGTEITFPLKVRIRYKHNIDGRTVTETQTICQEVSYFVDNSRIDLRNLHIDWLLYDFVGFLDNAVKALNTVKEQVDRVLEFVVIGCVSSFMVRLVVQVIRRMTTFLAEKKFTVLDKVTGIIGFEFSANGEDDTNTYCKKVSENIKEEKLKFYSNKDLERCFPNVASWWSKEEFWYRNYRFTCDRVFGHKTPSRWTEDRGDQELTTKLQTAEGCMIDDSVQGQPMRAVSCRSVAKQFLIENDFFKIGDQCFVTHVQRIGNDPAGNQLFILGSPVQGSRDLFEITRVRERGSFAETKYAVKQTDTSYLSNRPQTCSEVCGFPSDRGDDKAPASHIRLEDTGDIYQTYVTDVNAKSTCTTASQCKTLSKNPPSSLGIEVDSSIPRGYTSDCFFRTEADYAPTQTQTQNSVSTNPDLRYECCCLNAVKEPPTIYYQYEDKNVYDSPGVGVDVAGPPDYAFESKKNPEQEPGSIEDLKWSYRYWKEQYQTKGEPGEDVIAATKPGEEPNKPIHLEYNPYRYIEGRDFPACFGQNNVLYDGFGGSNAGESGNLLIIDPAKQHVSAFQCLHIAGISNRLTLLSNLMGHLSGCFKQVRETGTADAGVCKELFTRYVCSSIWTAIQWFQNSCLPFGDGYDFGGSENKFASYMSGGVKSVFGAVSDSQQELNEEYGNAQLNNFIGTGEEAIARKICLGAFGYDWEFSLSDVTDIAYATPFATLVTSPTRTREFLTIDPQSLQSKYEYRASWLINPGCDIESYRVDLACVGRDQINNDIGVNCAKVQDPGGNNCDCKNLDEEKLYSFFTSQQRAGQNALQDKDWNKVIPSAYRYDHLKFTLRPDRRIEGDLRESCFPEGHFENGEGVFYEPIKDKTAVGMANCQLDTLSGMFTCEGAQGFLDNKGTANFVSEKINGQDVGRRQIVVRAGEPITFQPTIYKSPGPSQCLVVEVGRNGNIAKRIFDVDRDGTNEFPEIQLVDNAQLIRNTRPVTTFVTCGSTRDSERIQSCTEILRNQRLTVDLLSRVNNQEVDVDLRFEDADNSGEIELAPDSVDRMIIDNQNFVIGQDLWKDESNGVVVDVADKGIKFKIRNVRYDNGISHVVYNVNIPEPTAITSSSLLEITYSLYHIEEGKTDCRNFLNQAELITYLGAPQQKPIKIKVTTGTVSVDRPRVNINVVSLKQLGQNEDLEVRVEITDDKEVDDTIDYELTGPSGSGPRGPETCSASSSQTGDRKTCTIRLDQNNDLRFAGTHDIEITTKDKDNPPNEEKNSKTFQVPCIGENYESYGTCLRNEDRCGIKVIETDQLALSCVQDFKCCGFTGPLSLETR